MSHDLRTEIPSVAEAVATGAPTTPPDGFALLLNLYAGRLRYSVGHLAQITDAELGGGFKG